MSKFPKLNNFVSEIDQFLQSLYKQKPALSLSQKKEKEKYARIYFLRDVPERLNKPNTLWDEF